ncbi:cell division protein SepF [Falsarthrobacter nasiphocae]|uniref:Cell division protein SepF n=1 Tax=Falsarthrobacter nasiphocae TaxID=189863 RepID=A0AAE3YFK3_9MICC|nr:cell division protein SepF [Falsarthrobacter nasiphocae]MDR6891312.1 cell division inhibitor SepF [Falsarthrobacter nasiphocae]
MTGKIKKTMIYLGLADDESAYEDERAEPRSRPERFEEPAAQPVRERVEQRSEPVERQAAAPARHEPPARQERPERSEPREASRPSVAAEPPRRRPQAVSQPRQEATVTPLKPSPDTHDEESPVHQITTIHPKSYNEAKLIGDSFRQGIPVIMNVTDIQESEAKRLVDFSAGLVFGLGGRISRVTNKVFLLTPEEIDVKAEGEAGGAADDEPILGTR